MHSENAVHVPFSYALFVRKQSKTIKEEEVEAEVENINVS